MLRPSTMRASSLVVVLAALLACALLPTSLEQLPPAGQQPPLSRASSSPFSSYTKRADATLQPRAEYVMESRYFHVKSDDTQGNNVNVTFKDYDGNLLSSYVSFNQILIRELDAEGHLVDSYTAPSGWTYATGSEAAGNVSWITVTGTYDNGAAILWKYQVNQVDLPISYAGLDYNLTAGSFKFSMDITNWPFDAEGNFLQVVLWCTTPNVSIDFSAIEIDNTTGGVQKILLPPLFTAGPPYIFNFLRYYLADDVVKTIGVWLELVETTPVLVFTLQFTFRHAFNTIFYDPDLGALVTAKEQGGGEDDGSGIDGGIIAAIVTPVAVVVAAVVVVVVAVTVSTVCYLRKRHTRRDFQGRIESYEAECKLED